MSRRSKKKTTPQTPPAASSSAVALKERWIVLAICFFLAAIIWVVFGRTVHYGFVNYDDELYIADNPVILHGLSLSGIAWAFTHSVNLNWTPLTVISHMLDCQLYGTRAGWHHLTNVLLHIASAITLFLVIKTMTGALWRSAFVAAMFAVHPLHVESVAWIAERRDVLSGLFFMLTLGAYVGYVRHPRSPGRYLLVMLMLALALMSKPMVVTLPMVLLLLDYWPLKRFGQPGGAVAPWRLIVEKLPLLALSGAVCVITLLTQKEAITPLPFSERAGNALVSYVVYLVQMIYPVGLAAYYPYPEGGPALREVIVALAILLLISGGVIVVGRKHPWVWVGWLWYLGMLVPVIGLVQAGLRAHADRYTYLPEIGLFLIIAWMVAGFFTGRHHGRLLLGTLAAIVVAGLVLAARNQVSYWKDSEALWKHTLECTSGNYVACNNLGLVLLQKGRTDEAMAQFRQALQFKPDYEPALNNLGDLLLQTGKVDEAIGQFKKALQNNPNSEESLNNLGSALLRKGKIDEAIGQFKKAAQLNSNNALTYNNFGNALLQQGNVDEAIAQFKKAVQLNPNDVEVCYNIGTLLLQSGDLNEAILYYHQAIQIQPDYAEAHNNLGTALLRQGKVDEAMGQFKIAVQIKPDYAYAQNNLAWALVTAPQASLRNVKQAVEHAQQANQLSGGKNPFFLRTLADAYAEAGRYSDAIECAHKAMELARAMGQTNLMKQINDELKLFTAGQSVHRQSK